MSWLFASGDQNIGASASASVPPMNIQDWFPLGLTALVLLSKGLLQHHSSKASVLQHTAFYIQLSHLFVTTGKTKALTRWTFVSKVMSLLFNTLSTFVIVFLPRSNLLISWLKSLSAVILEPKKRKSVTISTFSSSCHEVMGQDTITLVFWMSSFKSFFFFALLFHLHQEALYFLCTFCHLGAIICISEVVDILQADRKSVV